MFSIAKSLAPCVGPTPARLCTQGGVIEQTSLLIFICFVCQFISLFIHLLVAFIVVVIKIVKILTTKPCMCFAQMGKNFLPFRPHSPLLGLNGGVCKNYHFHIVVIRFKVFVISNVKNFVLQWILHAKRKRCGKFKNFMSKFYASLLLLCNFTTTHFSIVAITGLPLSAQHCPKSAGIHRHKPKCRVRVPLRIRSRSVSLFLGSNTQTI